VDQAHDGMSAMTEEQLEVTTSSMHLAQLTSLGDKQLVQQVTQCTVIGSVTNRKDLIGFETVDMIETTLTLYTVLYSFVITNPYPHMGRGIL
jgi:hypothetical protein